jgi:hypothetical protein
MHIFVAPIFVMTESNGIASSTSEQQTGAICVTPVLDDSVTCTSVEQTGTICVTPVSKNGFVACGTRSGPEKISYEQVMKFRVSYEARIPCLKVLL